VETGVYRCNGPNNNNIRFFVSSFIVLLLNVFSINVQALEQARHNLLVHVIGGCFLVVVGFYMVFFLKEKQVSIKNLFLYTFLEPFLFPTTIATFMWISPDILTAPISTKGYFFLGIIGSTLIWYFATVKLFEFITRKGFKKIEMVNIFFGSIFIVIGFIIIILTNYEVISTFGDYFLFDLEPKIG
jgi:hypothetical protein